MISSDFIQSYLHSKYEKIQQSTNNQQRKQHKFKRCVNKEVSYCFNNDVEEPKHTLIHCQILLSKKCSNYGYIISSDAISFWLTDSIPSKPGDELTSKTSGPRFELMMSTPATSRLSALHALMASVLIFFEIMIFCWLQHCLNVFDKFAEICYPQNNRKKNILNNKPQTKTKQKHDT